MISKLFWHKGSSRHACRCNGKYKYFGNRDTTPEQAQQMYDDYCKQQQLLNNGAVENDKMLSVAEVLSYYLANSAKTTGKANRDARRYFCNLFIAKFGAEQLTNLKADKIERWLSEQETWSQTYRCNACKHLSAAFNWMIAKEYTTRNPIKGVDRPKPQRRGFEYVISEEEYQKVLALCNRTYKPIVELLWHTGARPQEILSAKAEEYHPDRKILDKGLNHKTADKDAVRHIPLNNRAMEIMQEVSANKQGLLFPSEFGNARDTTVLARYLRKRFKQSGITHPVCNYSFRHTAAVRWIKAGIPIHVVASWLGHTVRICEKHYAHLLKTVSDTVHLMPD